MQQAQQQQGDKKPESSLKDQDQAIEKPMQKGQIYSFKMSNCTGCKKCAEICPCGFIEMV